MMGKEYGENEKEFWGPGVVWTQVLPARQQFHGGGKPSEKNGCEVHLSWLTRVCLTKITHGIILDPQIVGCIFRLWDKANEDVSSKNNRFGIRNVVAVRCGKCIFLHIWGCENLYLLHLFSWFICYLCKLSKIIIHHILEGEEGEIMFHYL